MGALPPGANRLGREADHFHLVGAKLKNEWRSVFTLPDCLCGMDMYNFTFHLMLNPLYAELNSICHFLALLGVHRILHVSRIRVKLLKPTGYMMHQQV